MDLIFTLKSKCYITDDQIRSKTPLSPSEYRGLTSILVDEELSAADFSAKMDLSPSRGSRVIEKMIQNGYLKRQTLTGDRRTVLISLAPRGSALKEQIMLLKKECERKIKDKLSEEELTMVEMALRKLVEIL